MSAIYDWAARWGIPTAAVQDLQATVFDSEPPPTAHVTGPESVVLAAIRLEASRLEYRLWRNNIGAAKLANGSFVRWGLCNDSARANQIMKSSDLIGIGPTGQFVARECKAAGWVYSGTPREIAQKAFIDFINARGGNAAFATSEGTL